MAKSALFSVGIVLLALGSGVAQLGLSFTPSSQAAEATFHSSSNLVLVPVFALKNGLPDKTLNQDDFQIFDNGKPVSIKTFDSGAKFTTRPLALWFLVQCNMQGWEAKGSGLFAGRMSLFKPPLEHLDKQDAVAVAHWCDDGQSELDLLPTGNVEDTVSTLERVLAPTYHNDHGRPGELALQKTLQLIIDATHVISPEPAPVVIFLYGDYSGMPKAEANHFIDGLLENSAIVYGLRDRRSSGILILGEEGAVANYIATKTGGQYFRVTPETYAMGLEEILRQLRFRYDKQCAFSVTDAGFGSDKNVVILVRAKFFTALHVDEDESKVPVTKRCEATEETWSFNYATGEIKQVGNAEALHLFKKFLAQPPR